MKSFALLRTNVGLTTNIKVVCDSIYGLSLDSIESDSDLSLSKFKKKSFNKRNFYDELIPYFYNKLPIETAFTIKYDDDVDKMATDFSKQYDEMYEYGARNIINNKSYNEEFEYFAPLYINKQSIPTNFIIFRVDGPGVGLLSKENFNEDLVKKFKVVKLFDLTQKTHLGEWIYNNFTNNKYFPITPLEMDFRELEFCKWNGIDYVSGGYTSKSLFIDDYIEKEKEIFDLEKYIFDNYQKLGVVYPNIINFSFLFDDEPSTPDVKRKWSINRYYGFYLDRCEKWYSYSPYITPFLKGDVEILSGNILNFTSSTDPFVLGFSDTRPFYVEYQGEFYRVEKYKEIITNQLVSVPQTTPGGITSTTQQYANIEVDKYRIIAELDLTGKQSEINKAYCRIEDNFLMDYQNNKIAVPIDYDKYSVWMIEIDGVFHTLINDGGNFRLNTDYSFKFNENDFVYRVAGQETKIDIRVDFNNAPKKFNVWRLHFTDIKDFDTRIVETESSKFEYIKQDSLTETDETKMYVENLTSNSNPKDLDDFIYQGDVVNIPVTSEYTANYETFKIEGNELSEIWRKNSVYCRWGYIGSVSGYDYPYLLNNSLLFEDFNRTANPFDPDPKRIERNLDYFLTINSSTHSYQFHSLHIEGYKEDGSLDLDHYFDLSKYLGFATYSLGTQSATYSSDYFTDFFYRRQYLQNGEIVKNVKKFAEFSPGDDGTPNNTIFRGMKFLIYDVDGVEITPEGDLGSIDLSTNNTYDGYKLAVLLSDNDMYLSESGEFVNKNNEMTWKVISEWKMEQNYTAGDVVIFEDVLYQCSSNNQTIQPAQNLTYKSVKSAPNNLSEWDFYLPQYSIFWEPVRPTPYAEGDYVYNSGDYWYCVSTASGVTDFWNPETSATSGYQSGEVVLYKGLYWASQISSNQYAPDVISPIRESNSYKSPWIATQSTTPKWELVEIWSPSKSYNSNKFIVHKETLWKSTSFSDVGIEPGNNGIWERKYSIEPDTDYVYGPSNNPIIEMNDAYYQCTSNTNNSTLDNGIIIYVNKKWKNVLININVSDNTLQNIKNCDRDLLYNELYKKITALNFSKTINDFNIKYGFSDYLKYIVVYEDGHITQHSFSNGAQTLPCMIRVDEPDELLITKGTLLINSVENPKELKPTRRLNNGIINNLSEINYYNEISLAATITENPKESRESVNLHGGVTNNLKDQIWRHSGFYTPIFYDIQLFDKNLDDISTNTKFDLELTDFGLMKERKIQKVNRSGSVLKLKNMTDIKSIYPMLDEFGLSFRDFFIFSSTWDFRYHWETYPKNSKLKDIIEVPTISSEIKNSFGQPQNIQFQNKKNTSI